jgi:hypothetical protein
MEGISFPPQPCLGTLSTRHSSFGKENGEKFGPYPEYFVETGTSTRDALPTPKTSDPPDEARLELSHRAVAALSHLPGNGDRSGIVRPHEMIPLCFSGSGVRSTSDEYVFARFSGMTIDYHADWQTHGTCMQRAADRQVTLEGSAIFGVGGLDLLGRCGNRGSREWEMGKWEMGMRE